MNSIFIVLVVAGLMFIGAEVFVPGGILGTLGGLALFASAIIAFHLFPPSVATAIAFGMIIMVGVVIALWIRIFPRTPAGRRMTVSLDLKQAKGTDDSLEALVGKTGVTTSALRPAGFVEIGGHRIDVVTQGDMLDAGIPVRVAAIEGNRVVVEPVPAGDSA